MSTMGKAEVAFFMSWLTTFKNAREISKMLHVTELTIRRWDKGDTLPHESYRKAFNKALDDLYDELAEGNVAERAIAEALGATTNPKPENNQPSRQRTAEELIAEFIGDKKVRSTDLFDMMKLHGYTRPSVQLAATRMGVIKEPQGVGRGSFSLWSLS